MKSAIRNFRARGIWPVALFAMMPFLPAPATAQGSLGLLMTAGAGAINQVSVAQVNQDEFVTAMINGSGNLEVICWQMNENASEITRLGTYYGAPATSVSVSAPFGINDGLPNVFTTAALKNGRLDVIYWTLSNGQPKLQSELQGNDASLVSVASVFGNQIGQAQFMTAIRNGGGNLEVSLWYVGSDGNIHLRGTGFGGQVTAVSIAALKDSNSDVATAVQNSSGNLETIQWNYAGPGVYRNNTTYTSLHADAVAVAPGVNYYDGPTSPVNAFYTASVNAGPQQMTVSSWNQTFGLRSSAVVEEWYPQVAMTSRNTAAFMVSGGGDYQLTVFDQDGANPFTEAASAWGPYGSSYSIALVDTYSSGTVFAVAYRNLWGNLQIDLWTYTPPAL